MPSYEIKGKGKDTGRKRKRIFTAPNEEEAKQLAEADGTLVEEIKEIPPDPPTERQLDYAKDLGISIPSNATKDDLSDLISLKVDRDKPAQNGKIRRYMAKLIPAFAPKTEKACNLQRLQAFSFSICKNMHFSPGFSTAGSAFSRPPRPSP